MPKKPSKRVTLKDVAKAANVSLASASYAMNNTGSLGEERRQHILKVAKRLGYRQNMSARATRTGKTGTIGFLVPDMTNPFFPSLAQAVFQRARHNGYSVFLAGTEGDPKQETESFRALVDRGVDGVVWFPINDKSDVGDISSEIPTVVIDRTIPGLECIQADYAQGGREAIRHLQSLGHTRIGIVTGPMDVQSMRDRCLSAQEQIEKIGEVTFVENNAFSTDLEPAVVKALESRKATAIFAGADLIAIGLLAHARRIGLDVPTELSIVGFDDIPWASLSSPSLTTIEMPVDLMAFEAVDTLIRKIEDENDGPKRVIFETSLVARESVRNQRDDR